MKNCKHEFLDTYACNNFCMSFVECRDKFLNKNKEDKINDLTQELRNKEQVILLQKRRIKKLKEYLALWEKPHY